MFFHTDFRTIPHISVQSCFSQQISIQFTVLWKCAEILRKCTEILFQLFYGIPQNSAEKISIQFKISNLYIKITFYLNISTLKTQKTTVTFSPNNDLVIQNFDFELIIGYFELSKSKFKAFNLPQYIFQDKRSKFQVIKVEILTCKSQLSKCWVIKVKFFGIIMVDIILRHT